MPELSINANGAVTQAPADLTESRPTAVKKTGKGTDPFQNRSGARVFSTVTRWLVRVAAFLTAAVLVLIVGYILVRGIPNLKPSLFAWEYNSDNVSLVP